MGRVRFAPCPTPGCPELAASCAAHRQRPWVGRNGTSRRAATAVSDTTWGRLSRAAMRRDHRRCLRCGATATTVDHLVPLAWRRPPTGFNAHLSQLGSLCTDCHRVKTNREAAIGRQGRPSAADIEAHVRWWINECRGGTHAL